LKQLSGEGVAQLVGCELRNAELVSNALPDVAHRAGLHWPLPRMGDEEELRQVAPSHEVVADDELDGRRDDQELLRPALLTLHRAREVHPADLEGLRHPRARRDEVE